MLVFVAAALFVFKFSTYVRSQSEAARAFGLYEQGRLVAARQAMGEAMRFLDRARWRGMELADVARRLDQAIQVVEGRSKAPLSADATDAQRLGRARDLAMLERTDDALEELARCASAEAQAEVCNLRATIYETRGALVTAKTWYAAGEKAWASRESSPERNAGLATALKGIAFCQRKLGRLVEAEAAYRQLLAHAPTADTHFLLAQFYDDAQQSRAAAFHVKQAIRLDPTRYESRGRATLDKLRTSHFGCFSIPREP